MPFYIAISIIALGLIPSLSWLGLYLKKDLHPEPPHLIIQTFILGMISAPFVVVFQLLFSFMHGGLTAGVVSDSPSFFLWAAFVEEFFKFLIVWLFVVRTQEFDEPTDAIIYMIVAGLGFAAMENILFLFKTSPEGIDSTLRVWALRFMGATFLHALTAAITGYFIAIAWFFRHHTFKLISIGLTLATLVHFTFNLLILRADIDKLAMVYAFILLIIISIFVSILFQKILQRQKQESLST